MLVWYMKFKKIERYLRVNLLGPGPRLMKKEFTGPRSHKVWETLCQLQNHLSPLLRLRFRPRSFSLFKGILLSNFNKGVECGAPDHEISATQRTPSASSRVGIRASCVVYLVWGKDLSLETSVFHCILCIFPPLICLFFSLAFFLSFAVCWFLDIPSLFLLCFPSLFSSLLFSFLAVITCLDSNSHVHSSVSSCVTIRDTGLVEGLVLRPSVFVWRGWGDLSRNEEGSFNKPELVICLYGGVETKSVCDLLH